MTPFDRFAIFSQLLSRYRSNVTRETPQELSSSIFVAQCSACEEMLYVGEQSDQIDDIPCGACGGAFAVLRYRLRIDALEPIPGSALEDGRTRLVKPISDERIIKNFTRVARSASPKSELWDEIATPTSPSGTRSRQHKNCGQPRRRKVISEIAGSALALGFAAAICGGLMLGTLSGEKESSPPKLGDRIAAAGSNELTNLRFPIRLRREFSKQSSSHSLPARASSKRHSISQTSHCIATRFPNGSRTRVQIRHRNDICLRMRWLKSPSKMASLFSLLPILSDTRPTCISLIAGWTGHLSSRPRENCLKNF